MTGTTPSPPVVDVREVTRTYHLGGVDITALDKVCLTALSGEFIAIKGRSGSGKTTLLNIIGGLDRPDSGAVFLLGKDITSLGEDQMVELRRRQVSFIFQSFGLIPQYSAYETVDFALRMASVPRAERHTRTMECLELVGLGERGHHRPDELSGGQQQRLCIARAIANHPALILADEPTGELDSRTGREILSMLRQIAAIEETLIIVATHDAMVTSYSTANYQLDDGQLTRLT